MNRSLRPVFAAAALLALGACQTATRPVEVTRFHLGQPIERGTVMIEPMPGAPGGLEFSTYASAVARELQRVGYVATPELGKSLYVASVDVSRGTRAATRERSPFSIGIGGGTGGYRGGGVGLGVGFNLGGSGSGDVVVTQLAVQLKRRSDQQIVWEGRAVTEARVRAPAAQPGIAASKLAEALFVDFPGESGRTISVP